MARIRTIKPEFWGDEKMAPMDTLTRFVFLGLISMADDAGRLLDNIRLIDATLFPETADSARESLANLAGIGRIQRGETASGQRIIQIVNWHHQRVDHPNLKAALPPIAQALTEDSRAVREPFANDSRDIPDSISTSTNDQLPTTDDRRSAATSAEWPEEIQRFLRATPSPSHWEAEFGMWLNGGREMPLTLPDIVEAVKEYAANGEKPNLSLFRGYLRRAFKARKANEIGSVIDALKPETNGGGVFEKLLDLGELHPNGQFWRKERIEAECGERAYEAFRAIGGNDRLKSLTTKDRPWVRKEFVEAYNRTAS